MRNFGGRSGVVMPAEHRSLAAFGRHGITTGCGGTDTFTATDGTFTGSNTDLSWTVFQHATAALEITSNQLGLTSAGTGFVHARCEAAPCTANQFAQFDWTGDDENPGTGFDDIVVALRIEGGAPDFYDDATGSVWFELGWSGDGFGGLDVSTIVYDDDGTAHTGAADFNVIPGQEVVGSTFRCEANGDTGVVRVLCDSVEIYTDTNAFLTPTNPSGLYTGYAPSGSWVSPPTYAIIIDNWVCGDL